MSTILFIVCVLISLNFITANGNHRSTHFGYPNDCLDSSDCHISLSWALGDQGDQHYHHQLDYVSFNLTFKRSTTLSYVAVGLSPDSAKGNDTVIHCLDPELELRLGIKSSDEPEEYSQRHGNPGNKLLQRFAEDGIVQCQWRRYLDSRNRNDLDLRHEQFYVILAYSLFEVNGGEFNFVSSIKYSLMPTNILLHGLHQTGRLITLSSLLYRGSH